MIESDARTVGGSDAALPIEADVIVEHAGWGTLGDPGALVARVLAALAAEPDVALPEGEVAVVLTGDEPVRALNRRWRGKDAPTNVLSFPGGVGPLLGDVVLAYETSAREAAAFGKPLEHHAAHLVLHGLLHLLGHDHMDESDAAAMEALETRILARLGIDDPYRETESPARSWPDTEEP